MVYAKATNPSDLLWHSEEPSPFLTKAIQEQEQSGRALDLELRLHDYSARVQENVPLPVGPTVQLQSLWFKRKQQTG